MEARGSASSVNPFAEGYPADSNVNRRQQTTRSPMISREITPLYDTQTPPWYSIGEELFSERTEYLCCPQGSNTAYYVTMLPCLALTVWRRPSSRAGEPSSSGHRYSHPKYGEGSKKETRVANEMNRFNFFSARALKFPILRRASSLALVRLAAGLLIHRGHRGPYAIESQNRQYATHSIISLPFAYPRSHPLPSHSVMYAVASSFRTCHQIPSLLSLETNK